MKVWIDVVDRGEKIFYNRETNPLIRIKDFTMGWNPSTLSWLAENYTFDLRKGLII